MSFYEVWNDLLVILRILLNPLLNFMIGLMRYVFNDLVTFRNEDSEDEVKIEISINSCRG